MSNPKVTVAIPTCNRARYLGEAIQSVMAQTFADFTLLVLDNASDDDTLAVVTSFSDSRILYIRHESNIGIVANWNEAVERCTGEYLVILGDDDKLLPEFLSRSVAVLNSDACVGFTFCHCNKVNERGEFIRLWGYDFPPAGFLTGHDYLVQTVQYGCCLTNSSTVILRRSVFDTVGLFEERLAHNTFDFNMWIRIASAFDTFFIDAVLVDYRLHAGQMSERHWRTPLHATGRLGTLLELTHAIAILLQDSEAGDTEFRHFLANRLDWVNHESAKLLRQFISAL
jgi:glycosyltransferase involved in cell wall biosynthesis